MLAKDFIEATINPDFQDKVRPLYWLEQEGVHISVNPQQELGDEGTATLVFGLDELPGPKVTDVVDTVVRPKYRKYAKVLLMGVKKGVMAPMKLTDPVPDPADWPHNLEVFLRLEA